MTIIADLHCHSHYSDGRHSPEDLRQRALDAGLSHLAITDHDCTRAVTELQSCPRLSLVPGVEISCAWQQKEVHVVGLCFDIDDGALATLLTEQQGRRRRRIASMAEKLQALGNDGLLPFMESLPCLAWTRSHVAEFLVREGICKNYQKAFKQYLGRKGRLYEPGDWCSLSQAIATLTSAGGIAVLAHPGRYPISKSQLRQLLSDFQEAGGEAIETSYGNIDPLVQKKLQAQAEERGFYQSQGSDFHDESAHWTALGKFPHLGRAGTKNAIWHHPRWHS